MGKLFQEVPLTSWDAATAAPIITLSVPSELKSAAGSSAASEIVAANADIGNISSAAEGCGTVFATKLGSPNLRNRFAVCRTQEDLLELIEESLDVDLEHNALRFRLPASSLRDGIALFDHDVANYLCLCILTAANTVHRISFPYGALASSGKAHKSVLTFSPFPSGNSSTSTSTGIKELAYSLERRSEKSTQDNAVSSCQWLDAETLVLGYYNGEMSVVSLPSPARSSEKPRGAQQQTGVQQTALKNSASGKWWAGLVGGSRTPHAVAITGWHLDSKFVKQTRQHPRGTRDTPDASPFAVDLGEVDLDMDVEGEEARGQGSGQEEADGVEEGPGEVVVTALCNDGRVRTWSSRGEGCLRSDPFADFYPAFAASFAAGASESGETSRGRHAVPRGRDGETSASDLSPSSILRPGAIKMRGFGGLSDGALKLFVYAKSGGHRLFLTQVPIYSGSGDQVPAILSSLQFRVPPGREGSLQLRDLVRSGEDLWTIWDGELKPKPLMRVDRKREKAKKDVDGSFGDNGVLVRFPSVFAAGGRAALLHTFSLDDEDDGLEDGEREGEGEHSRAHYGGSSGRSSRQSPSSSNREVEGEVAGTASDLERRMRADDRLLFVSALQQRKATRHADPSARLSPFALHQLGARRVLLAHRFRMNHVVRALRVWCPSGLEFSPQGLSRGSVDRLATLVGEGIAEKLRRRDRTIRNYRQAARHAGESGGYVGTEEVDGNLDGVGTGANTGAQALGKMDARETEMARLWTEFIGVCGTIAAREAEPLAFLRRPISDKDDATAAVLRQSGSFLLWPAPSEVATTERGPAQAESVDKATRYLLKLARVLVRASGPMAQEILASVGAEIWSKQAHLDECSTVSLLQTAVESVSTYSTATDATDLGALVPEWSAACAGADEGRSRQERSEEELRWEDKSRVLSELCSIFQQISSSKEQKRVLQALVLAVAAPHRAAPSFPGYGAVASPALSSLPLSEGFDFSSTFPAAPPTFPLPAATELAKDLENLWRSAPMDRALAIVTQELISMRATQAKEVAFLLSFVYRSAVFPQLLSETLSFVQEELLPQALQNIRDWSLAKWFAEETLREPMRLEEEVAETEEAISTLSSLSLGPSIAASSSSAASKVTNSLHTVTPGQTLLPAFVRIHRRELNKSIVAAMTTSKQQCLRRVSALVVSLLWRSESIHTQSDCMTTTKLVGFLRGAGQYALLEEVLAVQLEDGFAPGVEGGLRREGAFASTLSMGQEDAGEPLVAVARGEGTAEHRRTLLWIRAESLLVQAREVARRTKFGGAQAAAAAATAATALAQTARTEDPATAREHVRALATEALRLFAMAAPPAQAGESPPNASPTATARAQAPRRPASHDMQRTPQAEARGKFFADDSASRVSQLAASLPQAPSRLYARLWHRLRYFWEVLVLLKDLQRFLGSHPVFSVSQRVLALLRSLEAALDGLQEAVAVDRARRLRQGHTGHMGDAVDTGAGESTSDTDEAEADADREARSLLAQERRTVVELRGRALVNVFKAGLELKLYREAYDAMVALAEDSQKKDCLRRLVLVLCDQGRLDLVCSLPWTGLTEDVESVLEWQAANSDITAAEPRNQTFYHYLYAFYIERLKFVKAAATMEKLTSRLEAETTIGSLEGLVSQSKSLLAAVAALRLAPRSCRWLLRQPLTSDADPAVDGAGALNKLSKKRKTITLSTERKLEIVTMKDLEKKLALANARIELAKVLAQEQTQPSRSERLQVPVNLSPEDLCSFLIQKRRVDEAFSLALVFSLPLEQLVAALATQCVEQQQALGALVRKHRNSAAFSAAAWKRSNYSSRNGDYHNNSNDVNTNMVEHNDVEAALTEAEEDRARQREALLHTESLMKERATQSWNALRDVLQRHDSLRSNFKLTETALETILSLSRTMALPHWLKDACIGYTIGARPVYSANEEVRAGRKRSFGPGFANRSANPSILLKLYTKHSMLVDACELAADLLPTASVKRNGLCFLSSRGRSKSSRSGAESGRMDNKSQDYAKFSMGDSSEGAGEHPRARLHDENSMWLSNVGGNFAVEDQEELNKERLLHEFVERNRTECIPLTLIDRVIEASEHYLKDYERTQSGHSHSHSHSHKGVKDTKQTQEERVEELRAALERLRAELGDYFTFLRVVEDAKRVRDKTGVGMALG